MSDEPKPQSIDSQEFRRVMWDFQRNPCSVATINALIAHIDAWGARLAGDATKDAARYRWLRYRTSAHGVIDGWTFAFPTHRTLPAPASAMRDVASGLNEAIDAQIAAAPKPEDACGS
jgi:hypothetical protein